MNAIYDISVEDKKRNLRFVLGMSAEWPLVVVGVNPSTADLHQADPTMRRVEAFVKKSEYPGLVMCNIFPLRAKSPDMLPKRLMWREDGYRLKNLIEIRGQVSQIRKPVIWAAWGGGIGKRKYLARCLLEIYRVIKPFKPKWVHCGKLTVHGHPRHPLYLPMSAEFVEFNIDGYVLGQNLT